MAELNGDNLYPRSGAFRPQEPENQKLEKDKEATQALKAMPLILERVKHLEDRIAFYSSVDAIPVDVTVDAEMHLRFVAINRGMKSELEDELNKYKELIEVYG